MALSWVMAIDFHIGKEKEKGEKTTPKTAVAIEAGPDNALPKVVASGRGVLAEQILRLAFENNVKVREDADLAALLATLELDHDIPAEAVVAVAEILARVFEANSRMIQHTPQSGGTP